MGSGFLVSAPLLAGVVGNLAIVCIALLLVLAYLVGAVIRFNIRHFEPIENESHGPAQEIAFLSRVVLVAAYFISITFYLELLSTFLLKLVDFHSEAAANSITSLLLMGIGGIGVWRGLQKLESVEKYAVSLNLGMIAALLVGLAIYNLQLVVSNSWALPAVSSDIDFHDLRILLGLLIMVQGFETSRYLGDAHPAEQRILTMRSAQLISTAIYLVFIALATVLFHDNLGSDVTAIMNMAAPVALILPVLLTIATIGSQFSAAVADYAGAGGLMHDLTHGRVGTRYAYLFIVMVALALTWSVNINGIIAYASRAFALHYTLQCLVAFATAWQDRQLEKRQPRLVGFGLMAAICFMVFAFGLPSE